MADYNWQHDMTHELQAETRPDLFAQEIEWLGRHRGSSTRGPLWEAGFIAGVKHGLTLLNIQPSHSVSYKISKSAETARFPAKQA